ncbi:hypothetical protein MKX01_027055 [Papaver californicum]|nr:hypothetical protein MKX01_027055 [Papaver californicum]
MLDRKNVVELFRDISEHLSLGNNKESDLLSNSKQTGIWSCEEPNSPFWSLPGVLLETILAELWSLEKENS